MKRAAGLLAVLALPGCAAQIADSRTQLVMPGAPGSFYNVGVSSMDDARFAGVVRQQYDFSCGSAALATLLHYHYGYDVREENAFRGMWAAGDQAQIRRVGFSLLDMKRWLASRGLTADGYQVSLDQIAQTGIPGVALIAVKDYRHFVVVKGISDTEVLLGDPSAGLTVMDRADFQEAWNGIYFVLADEQERGRSAFNGMSQWAGFVRAPIGSRWSEPVSQQALMLTAPFYGDIS